MAKDQVGDDTIEGKGILSPGIKGTKVGIWGRGRKDPANE